MKKLRLVLLILMGIVFLAGCNVVITAPDCCVPTPAQPCTLTVTAGYWVWGLVYINGQNTGVYIDFETVPSVMINVDRNQMLEVKIVDSCWGSEESHKEYVWTNLDNNYVHFSYWKNGKLKSFHQRCNT